MGYGRIESIFIEITFMRAVLQQLGVNQQNSGASTGSLWLGSKGKTISSFSPVDGKEIASIVSCDDASYDCIISSAQQGFLEWREWPSPKRGDVVRQIGDALRIHKEPLGKLVSYEMGKSLQEGYGEVQE